MNKFILLSCLLCFLTRVSGSPLPKLSLETKNPFKAMEYLMRFGYMKRPSIDDPPSQHNMDLALTQFQNMANIPETGILDAETIKMMNSPRCGVHDTETPNDPSSPSNFALQGKWDHTDLTYRINTYTPDLSRQEVDGTIAEAFQFWAVKSPLTFTQKTHGQVDIEIEFVYGDHGDGYPFDAQWGTLAHAFFPLSMSAPISGDTHFDESELWTIHSKRGANLLQVAVHEFGHALGIAHSNVRDAIMWPFARDYDENLKLAYDDILAIQTLYGGPPLRPSSTKKPTTTPATTTPSTGGEIDHCSTSFDAVTVAVDDQTYFFKDNKIFRLGRFGIDKGFPLLISDIFPGAPTTVDAALTFKGRYADAKTYLFKGDSYWRYSVSNEGPQAAAFMKLDANYPKKIKTGWNLDITDIDGAFMFGEGDNKFPHFVKGGKYWRHTGTGKGAFRGYPRNFSANPVFSQIQESSFDAVFQWTNGKTYFFKGSKYHRVAYQTSQKTYHVTKNRDTGTHWFSCE